MIIDIAACFKVKFEKIEEKIVFGFGVGETAAKGETNEYLNVSGKTIGKEQSETSTKNIITNTVKDGLHFVEKGGYPAAQRVVMEVNPPTESLITQIMNNFLIFKSGKDKAIKEVAEEFGNEIGDILFKNSLGSARVVLEGCAERSAKQYSDELIKTLGVKGSEEVLEKGTKESILETSKLVPVLRTIISGTISGCLNATGTYKINQIITPIILI